MGWRVVLHPEFAADRARLPPAVRDALCREAQRLEASEPRTDGPYLPTLAGSRYANLRELRLDADGGVWRVAAAFDRARETVVLLACDAERADGAPFDRWLAATADRRLEPLLTSHAPGADPQRTPDAVLATPPDVAPLR